jgi:hypothetical protein
LHIHPEQPRGGQYGRKGNGGVERNAEGGLHFTGFRYEYRETDGTAQEMPIPV